MVRNHGADHADRPVLDEPKLRPIRALDGRTQRKERRSERFEGDGERDLLGTETFTMAMATRAGLASGVNWKKFPEAMLWARCLTAGVRAHCPDALGGNPVYAVEELSPTTEVDADGRPIVEAEDAVVITPELAAKHARVSELIKESGVDVEKFREHYAVAGVDDLDEAKADHAIDFLLKRIELNKS